MSTSDLKEKGSVYLAEDEAIRERETELIIVIALAP